MLNKIFGWKTYMSEDKTGCPDRTCYGFSGRDGSTLALEIRGYNVTIISPFEDIGYLLGITPKSPEDNLVVWTTMLFTLCAPELDFYLSSINKMKISFKKCSNEFMDAYLDGGIEISKMASANK